MGPTLCAGTEPALSSGIEAYQWLLEGGRDLHSGERQVDLFIPGRRLGRCHDRFPACRPAWCCCRQALLPERLACSWSPPPRVINVDGNPSYPKVVAELKQECKLGRQCRCRTCPYLNDIVEQDHRAIKRRVNASQGFRSFHGARRTIQGYEVVHMIRKGQMRWLPKGDGLGLILFLNELLGLSAE